jgi:hypothetical protein
VSDLRAEAEPSRVTLAAKVIRVDGSVEDLGTIAYYHKNPVRRLLWRLFHIAT